MTNIYYIARKRLGSKAARACVRKLLATHGLKFLCVEEQILHNVEVPQMPDFEDAGQAESANSMRLWS